MTTIGSTSDDVRVAEIAAGLTDAQRAVLKKQLAYWPGAVEGGSDGNPFATLCDHCFGRHSPPHESICPYPSLKGVMAKDFTAVDFQSREVRLAVAHLLTTRTNNDG